MREVRARIVNKKIMPIREMEMSFFLEDNEGREIILSVIERDISRNQENYYWAVIIKSIMDVTGYSKNETHELMKNMFLSGGSTKELTTSQAEKYYSEIRGWASVELGLYLPLPNEK